MSTIVLVDDQSQQREPLELALRKDGFTVQAFATSDEALAFEAVADEEVNYVVDLHLGPKSKTGGIELIAKLRSRAVSGRRPFICALTSHTDLEDQAAAAGADVFVRKERTAKDALVIRHRLRGYSHDDVGRDLRAVDEELAAQLFASLRRQATELAKGKLERSMLRYTVREALSLRYRSDPELQMLVALDRVLGRTGRITPAEVELCSDAASMLANHRATYELTSEWLRKAQKANLNPVASLFEDDPWGDY